MYIKLPPCECNNCGYNASGSAFVKSFGRFYFGSKKCPICKSKDISEIIGLRSSPPPLAPKVIKFINSSY